MNPRCRHVWLFWSATCASTFAYLELRAYYSGCRRTLSQALRDITGVNPRKPYGKVAPMIFALFGGWLTYHVLTLEEEPPRARTAAHGPGYGSATSTPNPMIRAGPC